MNKHLKASSLQSSVENPFQLGVYAVVMMYSFFDIFMVTHFGNEIKFASSRLSYNLFQCNWFDQPESSKKCISILMEVLKRPQELVVGKVYPLDLVIFTKVSQYSHSKHFMPQRTRLFRYRYWGSLTACSTFYKHLNDVKYTMYTKSIVKEFIKLQLTVDF